MRTINLRDFYPEIYSHDYFIDVPFAVVLALLEADREQEAYRIRTYRHKAYYSLDYGDDIEHHALLVGCSPYDLYEKKMLKVQLYAAIDTLPPKQRRRIYEFFFLGMSKADIARAEGVHKMSVAESISRGLAQVEEFLKKLL